MKVFEVLLEGDRKSLTASSGGVTQDELEFALERVKSVAKTQIRDVGLVDVFYQWIKRIEKAKRDQ